MNPSDFQVFFFFPITVLYGSLKQIHIFSLNYLPASLLACLLACLLIYLLCLLPSLLKYSDKY